MSRLPTYLKNGGSEWRSLTWNYSANNAQIQFRVALQWRSVMSEKQQLVDLSQAIEDGLITYKGLSAQIICEPSNLGSGLEFYNSTVQWTFQGEIQRNA